MSNFNNENYTEGVRLRREMLLDSLGLSEANVLRDSQGDYVLLEANRIDVPTTLGENIRYAELITEVQRLCSSKD